MAYDVSTDATAKIYIPNQLDYPGSFWQGAVSSSSLAATPGDWIKNIVSGISGQTWQARGNLDTRRVQLGAERGSFQGGVFATNNGNLGITSSTSLFNALHEGGYLDVAVAFKLDSGYGSKTRPFCCNENINSTGIGIFVGTLGTGSQSVFCVYINNGSGRAIILQTTDTVSDNAWHAAKAHIEPGAGASWIQVDNGTRSFGTLGTLGTGNTAFDMCIGNRASSDSALLGQFRDLRVGTSWTDELEAIWDTENPVGSITGHPEIANSVIHYNANKDRGYNPTELWFAGKLIYSSPATDGAVFDDNGADDSPDGTSWRGGPHGRETVASATYNGTAIVDGELYGEGTLTVNSTIGDSFTAVKSFALSGNARRDTVRLTRLADGMTINPHYPLRFGRASTFSAYLALDADGATTANDDTFGDADGETIMPADTVGVAQFSSSLGVMVLTVLTRGVDDYDYTFNLYGEASNKRLYVELATGASPAQGAVIEMAAVQKFYETDAGSWKALAATELAGILKAGKSKGAGIGCRMGMGL